MVVEPYLSACFGSGAPSGSSWKPVWELTKTANSVVDVQTLDCSAITVPS